MKKYKSAYHGGSGKIGYYPVSRLAGIDIDEEEDFLLVEKIILSNKVKNSKPKYYK